MRWDSCAQVLLMFMFAPLAVGPLAHFVLGVPISPLLWPTIAATIFGAGVQGPLACLCCLMPMVACLHA